MLTSKMFVAQRSEVGAMFPGFRRALEEVGVAMVATNPFTNQEMSFPTWDPTPDAPFPPGTIDTLDDVPGEIVAATSLSIEILDMAVRRSPEISRSRPLWLGPHERRVYAVPPRVVEGVLRWDEPRADLAERLERFSTAWGHADEHGEEMALPGTAYFDWKLEKLRDATFHVEHLKAKGPGSRPSWEARFRRWEEILAALVTLARSVGEQQELFHVDWFSPDPE